MFLFCESLYSQNEIAFCKAVDHSNFKNAEKIFKKVVKKNKTAPLYINGEGYQNNYSPCYDSIIAWLKKQACVADVFMDKCEKKVAIYPGHSTIGVAFRTPKGIIEKCFLIQEGTIGQINLLGWRPKIFKSKNILVYNKMYNSENFIEQQKRKCGIIN